MLLLYAALPGNLSSSTFNYIFPYSDPTFSNYGSIGIIQNPNARFLPEGSLSLSWSHNDPYLRGSIVANPFNWFEASFQYTDINNQLYSPFKEFSGNQSLKDKSFDAKFLLLKESIRLPQVAVGLRDLAGTGLFSSEYIVASKFLRNNLDVSIGVGWGKLTGNSFTNPLTDLHQSFDTRNENVGLGGEFSVKNYFSGSAGYFAGIEYSVPKFKGLKIKLEIDGTNYETEAEKPITQDSRINFGIVYPVNKYFNLKLSHTRGNTINFGFAYKLKLSKKNPLNVKKNIQAETQNSNEIKFVTDMSKENLYLASLRYLKDGQIYLQNASINKSDQGKELEIVYSQNKYRSKIQAAGRALNILDSISPNDITSFKLNEINGGTGMSSLSVDRRVFSYAKKINTPEFLLQDLDVEPYKFLGSKYEFNPKKEFPAIFSSISPDIRSNVGGPDGFFFADLKLTHSSEILFNPNFSLVTVSSVGLIDNLDELKLESDSILPHVRTDIVKYLKQSRGFSIRRMQFNFFNELGKSFYAKISGGIFESMFNGIGGEILYRPFDKDYAIGVEAWQVYQREYDQMFKTRDYNTLTGHATFYYQEPRTNVLLKIKGGKYLAKDSGFTFDVSREFRSGVRMGAFFSRTDISAAEFGEGSFDKGFYFYIPVEIFSPRYFKRPFGWGLRPLTRDGAQSLVHGYPLWGVTSLSNKRRIMRGISDVFD